MEKEESEGGLSERPPRYQLSPAPARGVPLTDTGAQAPTTAGTPVVPAALCESQNGNKPMEAGWGGGAEGWGGRPAKRPLSI